MTASGLQEPKITWRHQLISLRSVGQLFHTLWEVSPIYFVATVFVHIARASIPVCLLWIPKQIVDEIIAVSRHNGDVHRIWRLLLLELILGLVAELLSHASTILKGVLGDRLNCHVGMRVIDHAASLDLASFEDPAFYDKLDRVQNQAIGRAILLIAILDAAQEFATFVTLSVGVVLFSPRLMGLLIASTIPILVGESYFSKASYSIFFRMTPERRELDYFRQIGASAHSAKEVRVFGLGSYLSSRYRELSERICEQNSKLAVRRGIMGWLFAVVSSVGYYCGYLIILNAVLSESISVGTFTFLIGSFARSRVCTERIFSQISGIVEQAVMLRDLFDFFRMTPTIRPRPNAFRPPCSICEGIEFRNVSFAYPGRTELALRNVTFKIDAGERLALVGENGSGKSTLVKLLLRLYDPVGGQILLDGVDLRDYDLPELRKIISVIFQDFMHYDLAVRDNIGFGDLASRLDECRLGVAAQKGGARELIGRFPLRYDQVLGRRFKHGIDLSGGEWQKIALARMLARDAKVFVLDEPTASLDIRAERDFFERMSNVLKGQTAVMISHRLSTVRIAERIIVLERGEILENGSHDVLVRRGGRYADLFMVEAAKLSV